MSHTIRDKKALLTRVRRIAGQAAALEKALEQESECAAILQQIAAIRGAVNGLMGQVLEHHIREHLGATDCTPQQRQQDLEVVLTALRSYLKWAGRGCTRCRGRKAATVGQRRAVSGSTEVQGGWPEQGGTREPASDLSCCLRGSLGMALPGTAPLAIMSG